MVSLQRLAITEIHVHATRQARVEATYRSHDVDPFELVWAVVLEDRRVLHRVFIGPGRSVNIAWVRVPRGRRIRMVICNFAVANNYVMREHSAHRLVEATSDGILRHFEVRPGFRIALMQLSQRLFGKIQSGAGSVNLEVSSRTVA